MSTITVTLNWWNIFSLGFCLGYMATVTLCLFGCLMNDKLMEDTK